MQNNLSKYLICILMLFITVSCFAQSNNDSLYQQVQKQLKELKKQRTQDSLKISVLSSELHTIIATKDFGTDASVVKSKEDSIRLKKQLDEISRIKSSTEGAPVFLGYDTLYRVFASIGPYTALERSRSANVKIQKLYERPFYYSDSLKVESNFNMLIITYEKEIVQAITDMDALWEGLTVEELAQKHRNTINASIERLRNENSFRSKVLRIGELLIIVAIVGSLFYFLNYLFRRLKSFLVAKSLWFSNGIRWRNYEILNKRQIQQLLSKLLDLLRIVFFVIILFSSVPFALKLFPATLMWAERMEKFILEPLKKVGDSIVAFLPDLVTIIAIMLIGRFLLRLLKYFSLEIERGALTIKGFYREWAKPTYIIVRLLFISLMVIIIFPYLPGSDTQAFQGVSIFLGLLISLGSSSAISNAIAGILITYMRPFQENEWIKTGNVIGLVISKNSLVTRLKSINNEDITVPNSAILTGPTINYSSLGKTDGLVITTQVKVRYDIDERTVSNLLISAANKTSGVTNRLSPYVLQISLNEINATYEINAITFQPENMYFIKSDLIKSIHNTFKEAKVPLSSVQYIEWKVNSDNDYLDSKK